MTSVIEDGRNIHSCSSPVRRGSSERAARCQLGDVDKAVRLWQCCAPGQLWDQTRAPVQSSDGQSVQWTDVSFARQMMLALNSLGQRGSKMCRYQAKRRSP
ncbi:hypothetical protein SKAU_G00088940 [Synaphobranchus kaupii]|uniref:Uncharacterized protein n=1 Tax=Synaphobranchus kaupii TaxID=118154 RepID=A0A9Q1J690_SYNKA|nr:hypothetical protein SKAU_G00088940 [Synaphobranchus kaupii]